MATSNKMKVTVIHHDRAEPAGMFDELLEVRAVQNETVRLDETNEFPG